MADEKIQDMNYYVVHDATKSVINDGQKTKETFHTISTLHRYNSKEQPGQQCWHIQYKKTKNKDFPETEVFDPNILLGALVSNYQVRCKALGHHLSGDMPLQEVPGLLRPEKALCIVWNGVDIKAVYGQDHFVLPENPLSLEELRLIGIEAAKKLNEWVSNGGSAMAGAIETLKDIQDQHR